MISIQGKGEVVATPDTASVTAGVTTQGETAREALDANTKAMADLIATAQSGQIDAKDIQTSGFSVNPQYVYPEQARDGTCAAPAHHRLQRAERRQRQDPQARPILAISSTRS